MLPLLLKENVSIEWPNEDTLFTSIKGQWWISRRGDVELVGGGMDSRGSYVLKILYVKTKESGPLGGGTGHAPSRSANEGCS